MDKDRFAKIAIEAQPHLDALERIAKREQMGIVSIARYDDGKTKIGLIGDDYRNTYVYEKSKEV